MELAMHITANSYGCSNLDNIWFVDKDFFRLYYGFKQVFGLPFQPKPWLRILEVVYTQVVLQFIYQMQ